MGESLMNLNDKTKNLQLLQEECAEVIMICSKIMRFGQDDCHPDEPGVSNRDNLIQELGDVLVFIDQMKKDYFIHDYEIANAYSKKVYKLGIWYDR